MRFLLDKIFPSIIPACEDGRTGFEKNGCLQQATLNAEKGNEFISALTHTCHVRSNELEWQLASKSTFDSDDIKIICI